MVWTAVVQCHARRYIYARDDDYVYTLAAVDSYQKTQLVAATGISYPHLHTAVVRRNSAVVHQ